MNAGIRRSCRFITRPVILICAVYTTVNADLPTAPGILRLTRDWEAGTVALTDAVAGPREPALRIDFDRPWARQDKTPSVLPLAFSRKFHAPRAWQGRQVWLTYDARRMASAGPHGFLLNGQLLPLKLPPATDTASDEAVPAMSRAGETWFVEIGSMLRFDQENVLKFRTRTGMPGINAGYWLYCQPPTEKVLLLTSDDLTAREMDLLRAYASAVKKAFAMEVLLESRSFGDATALRAYLKTVHASHRIGGAVLVGNHPTIPFNFGHCVGLHPRFSEDFDATWDDRDGDGILDEMRIDAGYGCEIWTSWIRKLPEQAELLEAFLGKCLKYLRGEMVFPGRRRVLPHVFAGDAGLDHVDLFMRPGDFASYGTHSGILHGKGPHRRVVPESALELCPGSLIVTVAGCHSGNITRPKIKAPEAYIFGRSNGLVSFAAARSGGGGPDWAFALPGIQEELAQIVPHIGVYYQYMIDMSQRSPMVYADCAIFMFGNPFINFERVKPARGATVVGRVVPAAASDIRLDTFYVSAVREAKSYGRVRVGKTGEYRIECIPPGEYEILLHLNPVEHYSQRVVLAAGDVKDIDWNPPPLWTLCGEIVDVHGRAERRGWVEIASENRPDLFEESQIYGVRADEQGAFLLHGRKSGGLWYRARSGADWGSPPQQVSMDTKTGMVEVTARLVPGGRSESRDARVPDAGVLTESPSRVFFDQPMSEDEYPEVDVVEVFLGLIPVDSKTVPGRMRTAKGKFANVGRTEYQLRLGMRLADRLDIKGSDKPQRYEWQVTGLGEPMTVIVVYSTAHTLWAATLRSTDRKDAAFWSRVPLFVSGDWVFVDLIPTAESREMEFRLSAQTVRGRTRDRVRDRVPSSGTVYLVKARTGASPALVVQEVVEP